MKVLTFDTETTGLPTERNASIMDVEKWPYIVQLSYVVYDTEEKKIIVCEDDIIKIDTTAVIISPESIAIHGITPEICLEKGIPMIDALNKFNKELLKADLIIGHNISFDKRMIMVECIRNKIRQKFTDYGIRKPEYCTMKNSSELCAIEMTNAQTGEKYFKYPTLAQLYTHLFKIDAPKDLHNSLVDVIVCLRCYVYIIYTEDIITLLEKDFPEMYKE